MKKKTVKATVLTLAASVMLPFGAMAATPSPTTKAIDKVPVTAKYINSQKLYDEFSIAALAKAGQLSSSEKSAFLAQIKKEVESKTTPISGTTLYKAVIALRALGQNPASFEGKDLTNMIYESAPDSTVTGEAYQLIALDTANYVVPGKAKFVRSVLVNNLLKDENVKGGWSYAGKTTAPDPDTTGMVLTALGAHLTQPGVKGAINSAVKFLESNEGKDGGFNNYGENSSSDAEVIIGLTSVGINPASKEFTKSDNPIQNILSFETSNGGFKWQKTEKTADPFSTPQVFEALTALKLYEDKAGRLYNFPLPAPKKVTTHTTTEKKTLK